MLYGEKVLKFIKNAKIPEMIWIMVETMRLRKIGKCTVASRKLIANVKNE